MSMLRSFVLVAAVVCPLILMFSFFAMPYTTGQTFRFENNLWGIDTGGLEREKGLTKAAFSKNRPPKAITGDVTQEVDSIAERSTEPRNPPDPTTLVYPTKNSKQEPIEKFPIHDVIGDLTDDEKKYNITAAVCHKTLFGDIDMSMVYEWVVYHRMLGFDHFFMSYIEPVKSLEGFDLIASLPYVTMFLNEGAHIIHVEMDDKGNPGYKKNYTRLGGANNQRVMEAQCTDIDAALYDWVYLADADEFLWWNEKIGVKEFLSKYHDYYDYLSFGKQMYSYFHRVKDTKPVFSLGDYPFTGGNYCLRRDPATNKASDHCPKDRSKLIVKPSVHKGGVNVHGTHPVDKRKESLHFATGEAHCKEWNSANMPNVVSQVRDRKNWLAHEIEEVHIHGFELSYATENGTVEMIHDKQLSSWFDFVASRGSKEHF